jgi:hypothetical protein
MSLVGTPKPADAAIGVEGKDSGVPGETVSFTVFATSGTALNSIDILPLYDDPSGPVLAFSDVLVFLNAEALSGLSGGTGECADDTGTCAFFFTSPRNFTERTDLALFEFLVNPAAQPGTVVNLDLGILLGSTEVPMPDNVAEFAVTAIPEPTSIALMLAGLTGMWGWTRCRRRPAQGPGADTRAV